MVDTALARLRRKLEDAELEHLRRHCSELATRLEMAEERAKHAEGMADSYWHDHMNLLASLTERDEDIQIGITRDGQVGVLNKHPMTSVPALTIGETYVATLFDAEEGRGYHLILLTGDNDDASWETQVEWAKSIGGELPTRVEQSILFAKHKDLFKAAAYWSGTEHTDPCRSWCQYFDNGGQYNNTRYIKLRARAVRRLPI